MTFLLPLLLLPLLACVALLPALRGPAAARVIIGGYALATLQIGSGSLLPAELAGWAALGPSQGMFVSLSTGIGIGGMGLWARRGWPWRLAAVPWCIGVPVLFWRELQVMPVLLGGVVGTLPLLLGGMSPRQGDVGRTNVPGAWLAPLMVPLLALVIVAVGVIATTSLGNFLPLAGAMERIVGASVLVLAMLMIAPWPFHRARWGLALAPAAVLMVYMLAGSIAPLGVTGWLPVVAMILVPSAIVASWRGLWVNALGSVAVLAVPRPGWQGHVLVALLVVMLLVHGKGSLRFPDRISFPSGALPAVMLAVALTLGTAAVLAHEVVLGSLLAAGLAAAAARPERRPLEL